MSYEPTPPERLVEKISKHRSADSHAGPSLPTGSLTSDSTVGGSKSTAVDARVECQMSFGCAPVPLAPRFEAKKISSPSALTTGVVSSAVLFKTGTGVGVENGLATSVLDAEKRSSSVSCSRAEAKYITSPSALIQGSLDSTPEPLIEVTGAGVPKSLAVLARVAV